MSFSLQTARHQIRSIVDLEDEYGEYLFEDFRPFVHEALIGQPGMSPEEQIKRFKSVRKFLKGQEANELKQIRKIAKDAIAEVQRRQEGQASVVSVPEEDKGPLEMDSDEVLKMKNPLLGLFQQLTAQPMQEVAPAIENDPEETGFEITAVVINGEKYYTLEQAKKVLNS